jgi:N-methylhydantoinase B
MTVDISDPVFLRVFWDRLIAVANEQATALIRTAFTPVLRDAQDLSAGLFDARGRMIVQAVTGTPGHINSMATAMRYCLTEYPPERLEPGDVLITNDPWFTSGHLNDLTVTTPIFCRSGLVGFVSNICHAIDIGGLPLSAAGSDVYEEGLFIPIMKLYRRGEPNEDLIEILRANVRDAQAVVGDIHAQVACNDVGRRRLLALLEEFGLESLDAVADLITLRSEGAMRRAIEALPDGKYVAEGYADGYGEPIHLKATVIVEGDELTVDYAGSSAESPRGINVVFNYTLAYTTFAVKAAVSPEVPNNDGSFRPVHVSAPSGSILNAVRPAPVAARHILGHFVPSLVFRALGEVLGERAMAAGADPIWLITMQGRRDTEQHFTHTFFAMGGTGARASKDGLSTTGFPSGVAGCPVEVTENLTPVIVDRRELRRDSGGAGMFRGGLGQTLELRIRDGWSYSIAASTDRTQFAAEGMAGGCTGARGGTNLEPGDAVNLKTPLHVPPLKSVVLELPGGGGFGSPLERDARAVLRDVLNGYISLEAARRDYGVALSVNCRDDELVFMPEDFEIDYAATSRLRAGA